MPSFTEYAEEILANAKLLDAHLNSVDSPLPSFDNDILTNLPLDMKEARSSIINATHMLKQLAQGPVGSAVEIMFNWTDLVSLRAIYHCKLAHAVPADGTATYESIADSTGLSLPLTHHFLRHAMANHIFAESPEGHVQHTAISRLLLEDPDFMDAVGLLTTELAPASARMADALAKWGNSGEPNQTAYSLQNDTCLSTYQFLSRHPDRARRFGAGMRYFTKDEGWNLKYLLMAFDWAAIDRPGSVVIDVGGGHGSVSQFLARETAHIHFIVQDLPNTVEQGRNFLPDELKTRVEFEAHDFFKEQVLRDVDVFLLRWIMHNWSDGYCVQILRNLVPAMKRGGTVVIFEFVLEEKPETRYTERMGLNLDMIMITCFNGLERNPREWYKLCQQADERFVLKHIKRPEGSTMSVVEVQWDG